MSEESKKTVQKEEQQKTGASNPNIIKEDEITEVVDVKMHEVKIEEAPASEEEPAKKEAPVPEKEHSSGTSAAKYVARSLMWDKKTFHMILFIVVGSLAALYFILAGVFQNRFFAHTQINGIACDYKTVEEVQELMRQRVSRYTLILQERNGKQEKIRGEDIGLEVTFDHQIEDLLAQQNPWTWPASLKGDKIYLTAQTVSYDESLLSGEVSKLNCTDESQMTDSRNAHLTEYTEDGYQIVEEVYGTRLKRDVFDEQVKNAVLKLKRHINLAQSGCYVEPEYKADSEQIQKLLENCKAYTDTTVTFQFGDETEVIDGSLISQWLVVDDQMNVSLNEDAVGDYVISLAEKRNTTHKAKPLWTSYGKSVTVQAGNYGWRINCPETKAALLGYLQNHENYTGEVVYKQTANSYGEKDYGSTYVEICLSAQHLWFYKKGALIVESDFVSGNVSNGTITHKGAYYVAYKKKNAVLRGDDYETPVNYWMPFHNGEGLHDAVWRSSFGGNIYKTNGSHGCVNLPLSVAKTIYNNMEAGTPVLIY